MSTRTIVHIVSYLRRLLPVLGIALLIGAALWFRWEARSDFKIYKESYKYLLLSQIFYEGYLPHEVYPNYPDFKHQPGQKWLFSIAVAGTAASYNLVIQNPITIKDWENLAHVVVIAASILTVLPLWLWAKNRRWPWWSYVLLTVLWLYSGSQLLWGRFIIADTLAALLFTLFIALPTIDERAVHSKLETRNSKGRVSVSIFGFRIWDFLRFILGILMTLTRPELGIIFAGWLLIIFLNRFKSINIALHQKHDRILLLKWIIGWSAAALYSNYFLDYWHSDPLIWLGIIMLPLVWRWLKPEAQNSIRPLFIIIPVLLGVYLWFNPEITRYWIVLLPLSVLVTVELVVHAWEQFPKKIFVPICIIILALATFFQAKFILDQKPIEPKDFYSDVAPQILNIAKRSKPLNVYVGQEEPYMWYDTNFEYTIIPLEQWPQKADDFNGLIVEDPYTKFEIAKFENRNEAWQKVGEYTSPYRFRLGGSVELGEVTVWQTQ